MLLSTIKEIVNNDKRSDEEKIKILKGIFNSPTTGEAIPDLVPFVDIDLEIDALTKLKGKLPADRVVDRIELVKVNSKEKVKVNESVLSPNASTSIRTYLFDAEGEWTGKFSGKIVFGGNIMACRVFIEIPTPEWERVTATVRFHFKSEV